MAYKKWESQQNPTQKWEEEKELEGSYVGKHTTNTVDGDKIIYSVETKNGPKDVWESDQIKKFFENIRIGSMVKITFLGKKLNPNTKRNFNAFEFQVDDSMLPATPEQAEDIFSK